MCVEITAMKGHYQKDMNNTPVNKKKWSKSKRRTLLRTRLGKACVRIYHTFGERRQRIRAWPALRSHPSPDPVDGPVSSGAMAPRNTTQYLMDLVYTELEVSKEACDVSSYSSMQSHVPLDDSVYSLSDSDYDRSLDFQQRDFENVFFRNEI